METNFIPIKSENLCFASSVSGYTFSIFGSPKLSIICGSCQYFFKTRDYIPFFPKNSEESISIANCPNCGKWNKMNVQIA